MAEHSHWFLIHVIVEDGRVRHHCSFIGASPGKCVTEPMIEEARRHAAHDCVGSLAQSTVAGTSYLGRMTMAELYGATEEVPEC